MLTFWAALGIAFAVSASAIGIELEENAPWNNGTGSNDEQINLQISTRGPGRNQTSPLLYGWMIEDISHSIEGGLYAELLSNRAFQGINNGVNDSYAGPSLESWYAIGDARLTLDDFSHPLTTAIQSSVRVDVPADATGEVGMFNIGWYGMNVSPQTYNVSMHIMATNCPGLTGVTVSLRSNLTGQVFASERIPISKLSTTSYTHVQHKLVNEAQAPNSNNTFAVTFDGADIAGSSFYVTLVSVFPETFKGRHNGLRKDLGENIYDLKPKFLRFPGGNNIEGQTYETRWIWNNTIGLQKHRVGRPGDWGYYNTNGFGLLEFLEWCEDMEMEPVLAIYAGYSLGNFSASPSQMQDVLQTALDEVEYCMGAVDTTYGAMRARDGHTEPFQINYVELGNEDFFSATYTYRFPILYQGFQAAYPNITLISTAYNEAVQDKTYNYTIQIPPGIMWDTHNYAEPSFFIDNFNFFDNVQQLNNLTDVGILAGEYSNFQFGGGFVNFTQPYPSDTHIFWPEMISAVSEAVYLLGAERNPNVAKMTTYAPTLANLNKLNWTPNLISFTADPNQTILSTSYYSQRLLNAYRGDQTLPVTNSGDFDPLYWVSTINTTSNTVYLKVVNAGTDSVPLSVSIDTAYTAVNGTILTNPALRSFNGPDNQTAIVPNIINDLPAPGANWVWNVPSFSISVLQFDL